MIPRSRLAEAVHDPGLGHAERKPVAQGLSQPRVKSASARLRAFTCMVSSRLNSHRWCARGRGLARALSVHEAARRRGREIRRRHRARTLEDDEAIARRIVRLCAPLRCVPDSGSPALSVALDSVDSRSNTCSIVTGIRPAPPAQLASLRRVALRCCTAGQSQSLRPHQHGDRVSGTSDCE